MTDRRLLPAAKKSKGFRNHLKKMFGRGSQSTPPSCSNSLPVDLAPTAARITAELEAAEAAKTAEAEKAAEAAEAAKIRAKYTHFRILVIGRANAGKTTLLKRVCNTNEDPVYSKVMYPLPLMPHSHHPFLDRLTPRQRCDLVILPHFSNHIIDSVMLARDP